MKIKNFEFSITTKTLLYILFYMTIGFAIFLKLTEDHYTLKQLSYDIQSLMLLIALLFYKEEQKNV